MYFGSLSLPFIAIIHHSLCSCNIIKAQWEHLLVIQFLKSIEALNAHSEQYVNDKRISHIYIHMLKTCRVPQIVRSVLIYVVFKAIFLLSKNDFYSIIQIDPVLMSLKDGYHRPNQLVFKAPAKEKKSVVVNGIDLLENVPPRTENEVCASLWTIHPLAT